MCLPPGHLDSPAQARQLNGKCVYLQAILAVQLHDDEDRSGRASSEGRERPEIIEAEVSAAIKKIKERREPGIDEIATKCLKALNGVDIGILTDLCHKIYRKGFLPEDFAVNVYEDPKQTKSPRMFTASGNKPHESFDEDDSKNNFEKK